MRSTGMCTKVRSTVKEVYCDVAVKLSGNIVVHALAYMYLSVILRQGFPMILVVFWA